jgi:phosphoglycolate phosphatase-like HAD superfamily hydrolase
MKPYKNQDPIRLVVADVDGTLVTQEKVLTAKTKEAVSQLTAAGIAFAITSGRPPRGMQTVIKDVNLSTVVAGKRTTNGPAVAKAMVALDITLIIKTPSLIERKQPCQ